jgi:hypothetical protein
METDNTPVTRWRRWGVLPIVIIGGIAAIGLIGVAIEDPVTTSATDATTTSEAPSTSTSTSTTLAFTTQTTAPAETTTTSTTAAAAAAATTSVVATACRNSTSASCGAFRFDPAPGDNRPISIEVRWDNSAPRAGEEVVFTATVSDPDASPIKEGACGTGAGVAFGDGAGIPTSCSRPCGTARYGPWTPPASSRGAATFQFRHTYGAAGSYPAAVAFASADGCNPYASVNHLNFTVTIVQ